MPPDVLTLAYFAGILDGEGCIGISKRQRKVMVERRRSGRKEYLASPEHTLRVSIGSTTKELLLWLQGSFGGTLVALPKRENRKPAWIWALSANRAADFLDVVKPFVRIKAGQLALALEYQRTRVNQSGRTRDSLGRVFTLRIPESELARREEFKTKISQMNQEGSGWLH